MASAEGTLGAGDSSLEGGLSSGSVKAWGTFFFFLNSCQLGPVVDSFSTGTWVRLEVGVDGGLEESRPTSSPWRLPEERGEHRHPSVPGWKKPGWSGFCSQAYSSQGRGRTLLHPGPPESRYILCLLYWFCWLGERELGPGLGGSELALGARGV